MENDMKGTGKMINKKVRVLKLGQMALHIKVAIKMVLNKVLVSFYGPMVVPMKASF